MDATKLIVLKIIDNACTNTRDYTLHYGGLSTAARAPLYMPRQKVAAVDKDIVRDMVRRIQEETCADLRKALGGYL